MQFIEGLTGYKPALDYQNELVKRRAESKIDDTLIFLQHPLVFTFGVDCKGQADREVDVDRIPAYKRGIMYDGETRTFSTDRRGKGTHHGPGQLVGYVIADIKEKEITPVAYLGILEDAIVALLADYNITAQAMHIINEEKAKEHPGVIFKGKKIAAIGPAFISSYKDKRITKHGFALNVTNDVDYFKVINPCGDPNGEAVSMSGILRPTHLKLREIAKKLTPHITSRMRWTSVEEDSKKLEEILRSFRP